MDENICDSGWSTLNHDVLEHIGRALPLRDILSARLACRHWRQYVASAVTHLPQQQQSERGLVELDAQPAGHEGAWAQYLQSLATCLPRLSEIMVYVSSRVSADILGEQLRSLPTSLPGLTKLELRYIVPSSVPCLGTSLQQLQSSLTALTGLSTLYLIMGTSPEPSEVTAVLPALPRLRDLKLLSGLPQYGFTNSKLEALGCATQLQRLHLEVSGVGQVDSGLAALSRLCRLQQLLLDGLVTLGPPVVGALQQLPELRELKLELDRPQHIPDLFALTALTSLILAYHGDELDGADDPPPLDGAGPGHAAAAAAAAAGRGGGGPSGSDWDALERIVRGNTARPVITELALSCCSFAADPLPRLALLTTLRALTFYDCRWTTTCTPPVPRASGPHVPDHPDRVGGPPHLPLGTAPDGCGPSAGRGPARLGSSWSLLSALTGLRALGMAQCVAPPVTEPDLAALAAAWPGVTSLQLQSALHPGATSQLPPARFAAFLSRWSSLQALTLSGSWCNDPRVALDVSLLPPSLTSLVVSSVTLLWSAAARTAVVKVLQEGGGKGCPACDSASIAASGLPGLGAGDAARGPGEARADGGRGDVAIRDASRPCDGGPGMCQARTSSNCSFPCSNSTSSPCGGDIPTAFSCSISSSKDISTRSTLGSCSHTNDVPERASSPDPFSHQSPAAPATPGAPTLAALEHLVLGEVRLGPGLSLESLVGWAPNLRSLEITNLLPNLTDDTCTALAALTALTVLRVSQDQDADTEQHPHGVPAAAPGGPAAEAPAPESGLGGGGGEEGRLGLRRPGRLSGMGLAALTGLRNLRQLEWLPWGCEALGLEHVQALTRLRKLHLVTLRGARDGAIGEAALAALRERMPLCDIDDTEWSGLVDV